MSKVLRQHLIACSKPVPRGLCQLAREISHLEMRSMGKRENLARRECHELSFVVELDVAFIARPIANPHLTNHATKNDKCGTVLSRKSC